MRRVGLFPIFAPPDPPTRKSLTGTRGPRPGYSPELDGIRGLAIAAVLAWHYLVGLITVSHESPWWALHRILSSSWSGVDLFFVLSGYLIGGILEDNKTAHNFFSVFYWRRACRILPAYLLNLAVFIGLPLVFVDFFAGSAFVQDPLPAWSYLALIQNLFMALKGELAGWSVTWSLAVEEQFYLALPLLVRFGRRYLVPVLAIGCVASPILRFLLPNPVAAYVLPFARCDSLFLGVLLALLVRHRPEVAARIGRMRGVLPALAVCGLTMSLVQPSWAREPMRSAGVFVFALAFGMLLLRSQVSQGGALNHVLRNKALGWLGRRAYFVYLAHITALIAFHGLLLRQWPRIARPEDLLVTLVALLATLAAAEVSWRLIEEPAIRAGRRLDYLPASA